MPTMISPIGYTSHLLAEPDIEPRNSEEHHHHTDVNRVHHTRLSKLA
jgi:hypothetical protein